MRDLAVWNRLLPALILICMPSASFAINGIVLRPVVDMHSGPSENADVVSQAVYGTNVEILEERNNWARVRTPDAYSGWMYRANLLRNGRPYGQQPGFVEVTSLFANLYREPDVTKHKPLMTVPFETRLERQSKTNADDERWLEVRLVDSHSAFIQVGDVTSQPKTMTIPEMIALSRKFVGLPYLWGGTSTFGYDCSGFTQMLCRRRGIVMPRDANLQAEWNGVAAVDRNALRPGDLLFFGSSVQKITHTGMYIGNGEFINATTHQKPVIQICKLMDPHWSKLFVAARRIK